MPLDLEVGRNVTDNLIQRSHLIRNCICKIYNKLNASSWAVSPTKSLLPCKATLLVKKVSPFSGLQSGLWGPCNGEFSSSCSSPYMPEWGLGSTEGSVLWTSLPQSHRIQKDPGDTAVIDQALLYPQKGWLGSSMALWLSRAHPLVSGNSRD